MLKTATDGLADATRSPQSLVILPPTIQSKLEFLVVTVWYAEELPDMDGGGIFMNAKGIDAFLSVRFASNLQVPFTGDIVTQTPKKPWCVRRSGPSSL